MLHAQPHTLTWCFAVHCILFRCFCSSVGSRAVALGMSWGDEKDMTHICPLFENIQLSRTNMWTIYESNVYNWGQLRLTPEAPQQTTRASLEQ